MRILYVPLDERPCNAVYPINAAKVARDVEVISLPAEEMGYKKNAADTNRIWQFIQKEIVRTDYLIISVEMLLYGGLLPSRLHHLTLADLKEYESNLRTLKKNYPEKKLFLSNLIMRTPKYNSSDEEPDYYEVYGERIFRFGWLSDKANRENLMESEQQELEALQKELPQEVISDYETRRHFNVNANLTNIQLVKEGIIDFLSIPQDDSAPYGYTAIDQKKVYGTIQELGLKGKVMVYPGADEVGFTLLARAYNDWRNTQPTLFARYASTLGQTLVPLYEDRIINESLKAHVMAAGMRLIDNESEADFILAYNVPGKKMQESWDQFKNKDVTYDSYRHLLTFVDQIESAIQKGKKVGICDSAFANGGDLELLQVLDQKNLIEQLICYKAWNTNCNSLGSTLSALTFAQNEVDEKAMMDNLISNIFEDGFYQAAIRMDLTKTLLPSLGLNYFDLKTEEAKVMEQIHQKMMTMAENYLPNSFSNQSLEIQKLSSPWNRMFEIYCDVRVFQKKERKK
ncbi:DUF4127 family protein [Enterococcus songbeiensis]